jgi:hypothetical protein
MVLILLQGVVIDTFFNVFDIAPPSWAADFIKGKRLTCELCAIILL